jgi:anthranilate 1,2-dioxygenase small subunit
MDPALRARIEELLQEAARLIDEDRLEEWLGLFTEDCTYRVTTRENHDRGLPISLIDCRGIGMLQDRIVSLRQANIYNVHHDRHVVGGARVLGASDGEYEVYSSYCVYQTTPEGESTLFSVGKYLDRIRIDGGRARFRERIVVADTAGIPNLLATPL